MGRRFEIKDRRAGAEAPGLAPSRAKPQVPPLYKVSVRLEVPPPPSSMSCGAWPDPFVLHVPPPSPPPPPNRDACVTLGGGM